MSTSFYKSELSRSRTVARLTFVDIDPPAAFACINVSCESLRHYPEAFEEAEREAEYTIARLRRRALLQPVAKDPKTQDRPMDFYEDYIKGKSDA